MNESLSLSTTTTPQHSWRNDTPHVDEVLYKIILGDEQQLIALQDGKIDVVGDFILSYFITEEMLNDPNIEINKTYRLGFGQISFNSEKWPTNQRGLRRALAFAIDKWAICNKIWYGEAIPIDSPIVPSMGIWSIEHESALRHLPENYHDPNPVKGNHSLLQDGFYDINNDGWREWFNDTKAGKTWNEVVDVSVFNPDVENPSEAIANESGPDPDSFTVLDSTTFNDLANWENVSLEILGLPPYFVDTVERRSAAAYQSVGIKAGTEYTYWTRFIDFLYNGSFNAAFFGAYVGFNPLFLAEFASNSTTNKQIWRWSNTTYDEVIDILLTSPYLDDVLEAAYRAQEILWHEQPMIPMYDTFRFSIYRVDKLEGWIQPAGKPVAGFWSTMKVHEVNELDGSIIIGGTLIQSLENAPDTLNPLKAASHESVLVLDLIYDRLWKIDPYTRQIIPWMADSWTVELVYNDTLQPFTGDLNSVNLTKTPIVQKVTFQLNPNFKWHDEQPVTPEDVAYSYQLYALLNSSASSSPSWEGSSSINPNRIIHDNDAGTVTFILESLSFFSFMETGKWILPKHVWNDLLVNLGLEGLLDYNNDDPIGSGPFKWKSRVPDTSFVLERNDEWPFLPVLITSTSTSNTVDLSESESTRVGRTESDDFQISLDISSLVSMKIFGFVGSDMFFAFTMLSVLVILVKRKLGSLMK